MKKRSPSLSINPKLIRLVALLLLLWLVPSAVLAAENGQASAAGAPEKTNAMSGTFGLGNTKSNAPLYVKSNSLQLDTLKRVFTYRGNVEVTRDDMLITTDLMTGFYNEKNQIQEIVCDDNVVITRGEALRASSNHAVYKVPEGVIVLTESPELINKGNALTADKVRIFVDEDRSEAEGNVRVKVIKSEEQENPFAANKGKKDAVDESAEPQEKSAPADSTPKKSARGETNG